MNTSQSMLNLNGVHEFAALNVELFGDKELDLQHVVKRSLDRYTTSAQTLPTVTFSAYTSSP